MRHLIIGIEELKQATNESVYPYGTFTVEVRDINDHDGNKRPLEAFTGCNLNPNSPNFIAAKIGDKYRTWDNGKRRYNVYGDYMATEGEYRTALSIFLEQYKNGSFSNIFKYYINIYSKNRSDDLEYSFRRGLNLKHITKLLIKNTVNFDQ